MDDHKFFEAIKCGDYDWVKYYLDKGMDPKMNNNWAIKIACLYGEDKIVNLLIERGANSLTDSNLTFHWACKSGNIKIVDMLLKEGCPVSLSSLRDNKDVTKHLIKLEFSYKIGSMTIHRYFPYEEFKDVIYEMLWEDILKLKMTQRLQPYELLEIIERRKYAQHFTSSELFSLCRTKRT